MDFVNKKLNRFFRRINEQDRISIDCKKPNGFMKMHMIFTPFLNDKLFYFVDGQFYNLQLFLSL